MRTTNKIKSRFSYLLLSLLLITSFSWAQDDEPPEPGEEPQALQRVEYWLARVQSEDGSWGEDAKLRPGLTALSLLSLLQNGETPRSRIYGKRIGKGLKYLLEHRQDIPNDALGSFSKCLVIQALADFHMITKREDLKKALLQMGSELLDKQNEFGGFDFLHKEKSKHWDLRMSIAAFQAMSGCWNSELEFGNHGKLEKNVALAQSFLRTVASKGFPKCRNSNRSSPALKNIGTYICFSYRTNNAETLKPIVDSLKLEPLAWENLSLESFFSQAYQHFTLGLSQRRDWWRWNSNWYEITSKMQHEQGYWELPAAKLGTLSLSLKDRRIFCTAITTFSLRAFHKFAPRNSSFHLEDRTPPDLEAIDIF